MGKAPASSILEDRNPQTVLFNPTGAEQALISNRGGRSGDPLCSTLLPRVRVPFRRSLSKPILRCKYESSPRTVSTGESSPEKRGRQYYSRDARVLFVNHLSRGKPFPTPAGPVRALDQ